MRLSKTGILSVALAICAWAGSTDASSQEYIYPLTLLDASPRAAAMGGVNLGESTSDYLYTNPMSLIWSEDWIYASVNGGIVDKIEGAGTPKIFSSSVGVSKWGVALMGGYRFKGGFQIPKYDLNGIEIEGKFVHLADRSMDFGVAYNPLKSLPLGVYAKYSYYITSYGKSADAHSFTLGTSYQHKFISSAGTYDHTLTGTLEVAEMGKDFARGKRTILSLPTNVAGAVNWAYDIPDTMWETSLGVQGRYFFRPAESRLFQVGVGGEATFNKFVSLRLGYQYAERDLSFIGCGFGIKLPYVNLDFGTHISLTDDHPMNSYIGISFRM